jgi:peptidase S8 and S53, subtilisin, kexin, sedolisin
MVVDFNYATVGLKVTFENLSTRVPSDYTYHWDFGDNTQSTLNDPTHEFDKPGFYKVILVVKDPASNTVGSSEQRVPVTDKAKTHLSGSIYQLIDTYIPENIFGVVTTSTKRQFIEKWQLYLQPLVNHCIPLQEYNNEMYYEALENQLIMELAAYDFMSVQVANMVKAQAQSILENNTTSSSGGSEPPDGYQGDVKKIQTGPTQVEYFNPNEDESDLASNIIKALGPGGLLDMMKENLCMLAGRLDIYLPICERPTRVVVPKAVNKRIKGPLSGPDPFSLLK